MDAADLESQRGDTLRKEQKREYLLYPGTEKVQQRVSWAGLNTISAG